MAGYKFLYYKLFEKLSDITEELIAVQKEIEEIVLSAEDEKISENITRLILYHYSSPSIKKLLCLNQNGLKHRSFFLC